MAILFGIGLALATVGTGIVFGYGIAYTAILFTERVYK